MYDNEEEKICPIMARGWLSNKWAAKGSETTFNFENLPKCLKEKCQMWDKSGTINKCRLGS